MSWYHRMFLRNDMDTNNDDHDNDNDTVICRIASAKMTSRLTSTTTSQVVYIIALPFFWLSFDGLKRTFIENGT